MPIKSTQQALQVFKEEFAAAWTYGGLWVAVWHPFLSGRLSRAVAISNLIEHMHKTGDVWFATLGEIAEHIRSLVTRGEWSPRTDKLPYYDGPIPELGNSKPANVQPAGAVERPSKDR